MLPRRTITKKQKKEASKKKIAVLLIFIGLVLISISFFYTAFLEKKPDLINPLSKNQSTDIKRLEKKLKEYEFNFISISTDKDLSYIVKLDDKREVVLDSDKDIDRQLSSLQLIITQLKIDNKAFKRLDFRYKNPVITF